MPRPAPIEPLEARRLLHAGHGFHVEVNFQPAGGTAPSGYLVDTGQTYANRGNGQTYGWDADISTWTRRRGASNSLDGRFDTLNHLQKEGQSRKWELAVPNGYYEVRLVAGDPSFWDSVYKINVEGKLLVNGTPTSGQRWIQGSGVVQVTDGRLTISNATGSKNNKINFIDISQTDPPSAPTDPSPPPVSQPVSAGWSQAAAMPIARTEAQQAIKNGLLYVFGGFYNSGWDATKRVDVFDPTANTWTRLPDMPVAVTHAATVVDGNNVILAGGFVGDDPGPATKDVWMFNVNSKAWSKLPSLPAARGGGGAGIVGTKLYFFGGGTRNASLQHDADYGTTWELDLANPASGWKTKASMPTPRNHLAFAAVGGKVYAIGGQILNRENTGNQTVVHAYNPATNTWTQAASLPLPLGHTHAGTIVQDGRIVMAGGVTSGYTTTNQILSYDPGSNVWTHVRTMPVFRKSVNLMIHAGQLYVVGGGNNTATREVYKTGWAPTWLSLQSMPVSMGEVAAGMIGNKMYVIGEANSSTAVYDLSKNTWSTSAAKRPFLGHHHAAEVINGKWYVIGGLGASAGKLQIYNPATNAWSLGASMPYDGGSVASAVIGGKIYVAGGIVGSTASNGAGTGTTTQAAVYDPGTNKWSSIASMPRGANHAAAATDGQRLWVFGGRDGKNVVGNGFNTVQVYNPATNTWISSDTSTSVKPLPMARGGTGKAVFVNGEFYVLGGETLTGAGATSNNVYNRVDIYNPSTNMWRLGPTMTTARHGIFPVHHAGRIYVAAGGVKAAYSHSNVNEVLQIA